MATTGTADAPPAARRTQSERVAAMRARLLDATVACLAEGGYSSLSTNDVVRRARVSRGALSHHFPTKGELVTAAAQRLLDERAADFRRQFESIPARERTPAAAVAVIWSFYDSPGGHALIELTVAARHQAELEGVLAPMIEHLDELTVEMFGAYFPDLARLPHVDAALRALHALFAGLALGSFAGAEARRRGDEVRALLAAGLSLPLQHIGPMLSVFAPRLVPPDRGASR